MREAGRCCVVGGGTFDGEGVYRVRSCDERERRTGTVGGGMDGVFLTSAPARL